MATSLFCETFLFPASALLPWLSAGTCLLAAAAVALLVLLLRERRAAAGEGKRADDAFGNAVRDLRDDAERTRTALEQAIRDFREESAAAAQRRADAFQNALAERSRSLNETLHSRFAAFTQTLAETERSRRETFDAFRDAQRKSADESRETLSLSLEKIREENAKKLDEMRGIVEEKLQSTLEKRLGESFRIVSERLEHVSRSLGEMQAVAHSVSDLKRVLTNVKTRGTWGEVQLGALLEDILAPEQFERNFRPSPRSSEIVEFAVKLPGDAPDASQPLYLPIDSKFPIEDYDRLTAAAQAGDRDAAEKASADLARRVESFARDIRNKYLKPPRTTDFGILFLPTEGLYAEVLRRAGLAEKIQRECRVLVAGPMSLAALLNSLKMGFRTLAVQKNSAEISKTLVAVKSEFLKFGALLEKISKKLDEAQEAVSDTAKRHDIATRRLRKVESLDLGEADGNGEA